MNLYSAAYFSNESLHTLLASLALLATRRRAARAAAARLAARAARHAASASRRSRSSRCWCCCRSRSSSSPASSGAVDREPPARVAAAAARRDRCRWLAIAGWFYLRNWLRFGDPLMANWGRMPGRRPHLVAAAGLPHACVLHALRRSARASLHGRLQVLLGQQLLDVLGRRLHRGAASIPADRHGFWSYDFMSIGYWLALPATLLAAGRRAARRAPRAARSRAGPARRLRAARDGGLGREPRLSLSDPAARPSSARRRPPTCCRCSRRSRSGSRSASAGSTPGSRRRPLARAALHGWLAAFAGVLYLGFAG